MVTRAIIGGLCACLVFVSLNTNAALVKRLDGLAYYDTEANLTWLADAHLAGSNSFGVGGIEPTGRMDWFEANAWIGALNASSYLGFNGWRLPRSTPINGSSFNLTSTRNGTTDNGTNISATGTLYEGSTASELAYLYYNTLGHLRGGFDIDGTDLPCAPSGVIVSSNSCLIENGPFSTYELMSVSQFWTETSIGSDALSFSFYAGYQTDSWVGYPGFYAWAVADGDQFAVPVPSAVWLFGSGLIGLVGVARRKKS
jgi:hypothetical protein